MVKVTSLSEKEIEQIGEAFADYEYENGGAVYNYKNLAIIAPNGIRYMETYFTAGSPVNSRTTRYYFIRYGNR